MGEAYRRVILKPPGLGDGDSAALAERLAAAVRAQRDLASGSPHVLRLIDDLQETESSFFVEHEPASPYAVPLFDREAPPADEEELLRWTAALLDALRVAHSPQGGRAAVHGGLCGGTFLTTPDGIEKIADAGFAASICAALGVDAYMNLAVGPRTDGPLERQGTGVWEVLSPDVERDDRICGFIDPQKYGAQTLATFETGSDIIAAAFFLHLLAEHSHPYLGDPQDHRLVALAESMAWQLYNGARRKSLRESTDPRIRVWCDVVARMLANLPQERPSASQVAAELTKVGVKPFSRETAQQTELQAVSRLLEAGNWKDAERRAQALAAAAATPEITERANALHRAAQANVSIEEAAGLLETDDWQKARELLDAAAGVPGLRPEAIEKVEKLAAVLQCNLAAQKELESIEAVQQKTPTTDLPSAQAAEQAQAALATLIDRLDKLPDDQSLAPPLRNRRMELGQEVSARLEALGEILKVIEANHAAARDWLGKLRVAHNQGAGDVEQLLAHPPDIKHWPQDVLSEKKTIATQLKEQKTAAAWLDWFRHGVEETEEDLNSLDAAHQRLGDKPELSHWPGGLKQELDDLTERLRAVETKAEDYDRARQWLATVQKAVTSEDWASAKRELNAKPALTHWPAEVLEEEDRARPVIDEHLEEQERIQLWLQSADQAAQKGDYIEGLEVLDHPPLTWEALTPEVQQEAKARKEAFADKLEESRRRRLKQQTEAVGQLAMGFVRELVGQELSGLLKPDALEAKVDSVEWNSPENPTEGQAKLNVRLPGVEGGPGKPESSTSFEFEMKGGSPRLRGENALQENIATNLKGLIQKLQQH